MQYRALGKSGSNVSVISFGAWQLGDPTFWGEVAVEEANRTVDFALDCGIHLFDTAEMYGNGESERALGKALAGKRDKARIASKVSPEHCAPDLLKKACENTLRRMQTDYLDLYQVHWPCRNISFEDAYAALDRLRQDGKIREIGVSNFGPIDMENWMRVGQAVSNQIGYNLLFRAPEYETIPACRTHNLGVLVYMPLMQGLLSGRYDTLESIPVQRRRTRHFASCREGVRHGESGKEQLLMETLADIREYARDIGLSMAVLCLAWLIAQPGVTSVILGARHIKQLQENLAAADLDVGPAAIAQLNEISFPLKEAMGFNSDMWESEEHSRIQ